MEASRQALSELLELQKIDSAVDLLTARLHNLPEQAELDDLEERQRTLESQTGEREAALDEVVARQRKLDNEVENVGLKIAHEEARMNSGDVNSPRELSA